MLVATISVDPVYSYTLGSPCLRGVHVWYMYYCNACKWDHGQSCVYILVAFVGISLLTLLQG